MIGRMFIGASLALAGSIACHAQSHDSDNPSSPSNATASRATTPLENAQMNSGMPTPSRPAPPKVEPVTYQGVRYEQDMQSYSHGGTQPGGYLVAVDPATGARLWMLKVYEVPASNTPGLSSPGRYFRSMQLVPGRDELEIESEVGGHYRVDLKERKSTWISGPDSIHK